MRLRLKITLALTIVLGCMLVGNLAIQRYVVAPSFVHLERQEAVKDWERCRDAIARENEHLLTLCTDWAFWDDAYQYAQGRNGAFFDENLANDEWFTTQKMDVLYFVLPDGRVHWARAANHDTGKAATLAWLPRDRLPPDHPLLGIRGDKDSCVSGLVLTEIGPMMIAARPILTSQFDGPMAGILVFGRRLCDDLLSDLNKQTQVDFAALPLTDPQVSPHDQALVARAVGTDTPQLTERPGDRLAVVGVVDDLAGEPMLMVKTDLARHITAQGARAMRFAVVSLTVAAAATLIALVALLGWLVVRPLTALTRHTTQVAASGQLNVRIDSRRTDEIGQLACEFDRMMQKLDEYRGQSLALSRQAGMAEIATGVLHNVGNVLNSVNVSARLITDHLRGSRIGTLGKVVGLIRQEKPRLGGFLTTDPRGQNLPDLLDQLHAKLAEDQGAVQRELDQLVAGVEHIKEVVRMQQTAAKRSSNLLAPVEPMAIMEDAIKVNLVSMERHDIRLVREYEPGIGQLMLDEHKILQVLINLISNAKKATCRPGRTDRAITVAVRRVDGGRAVEFEVRDNGIGISTDDMAKLFRHGHTTFEQGHGFGLHSGANAATEMKGTLRARSDGPGHGASFTLTVPVDAAAGTSGAGAADRVQEVAA